MNGCLKVTFEGDEYDQALRIFCDEVLVFYGIADDLVTSINGHLQIRLNFSYRSAFLHSIRRAGDFVVLIPDVPDVDANLYLTRTRGAPLIWSLQDLANLWRQLRYDPEELEGLKHVVSDELLLVWLLSSGYKSMNTLELAGMVRSITSHILAENPGSPLAVKDIIQKAYKREALLESVSSFDGENGQSVVVYIEDVEACALIEWNAISIDREQCFIGGKRTGVSVKIKFSNQWGGSGID